jgi:hypothetical protein
MRSSFGVARPWHSEMGCTIEPSRMRGQIQQLFLGHFRQAFVGDCELLMTESEAIAKANLVISVRAGITAAPISVQYKSVGGRRSWLILYQGYTVNVNDKNGAIYVFENSPSH